MTTNKKKVITTSVRKPAPRLCVSGLNSRRPFEAKPSETQPGLFAATAQSAAAATTAAITCATMYAMTWRLSQRPPAHRPIITAGLK